MKKKTLFLLIIAILVILVGCDNKNNEFAITIQGPDNIETSYSIDYTAYIGDEKLSNDEVLWTISNKDTATLYKNQITGVNKGTIILSVVLKSDGTKVGTKIINVIDPLVTSLRIVGETKVNAGEEILLNVVVSPSDSKEVVKWSVDDPTLATLSSEETDNNSGVLLKGVSGGYVKVTATSASICTSFTVLVKGNVQEIKMYNSTNLAIGQVEKLEFNIDDAVVTLGDNDSFIYDAGNLVALKPGQGTLKVTSVLSNISATFEVYVTQDATETSSLDYVNDYDINSIIENMSIEEKVGQMLALSINYADTFIIDDQGIGLTKNKSDYDYDSAYLNEYIEKYHYGTYMFTPELFEGGENVKEGIDAIQTLSTESNNNIGSFMATNYNAYLYYVYDNYTSEYLSNYITQAAIGATSLEEAYEYYKNKSEELEALGINIANDGGFSIINDIKNCFSFNMQREIEFSRIALGGLATNNIILAPTIGENNFYYKKYATLESTDLLIQKGIEASCPVLSIYDNSECNSGYDTMAEKIRDEYNYDGVLFDESSEFIRRLYNSSDYDAFNCHAIILSDIKSGIDIIPIYFNGTNARNSNFTVLSSAIDMIIDDVETGVLSIDIINAAVERILSLKAEKGIIDTDGADFDYVLDASHQELIDEMSKKAICVDGEFSGLDKTKKVYVFSDRGWYSSDNFASYFEENADTFGYNDVVCNKTYDALLGDTYDINTEDQVVLYFNNENNYYQIFNDGEYQGKWAGIDDVIAKVEQYTNNIILISPNSEFISEYDEFVRIYTYNTESDSYSNLIEIFNTGISYGKNPYE